MATEKSITFGLAQTAVVVAHITTVDRMPDGTAIINLSGGHRVGVSEKDIPELRAKLEPFGIGVPYRLQGEHPAS